MQQKVERYAKHLRGILNKTNQGKLILRKSVLSSKDRKFIIHKVADIILTNRVGM
jgi:hypothetical protein